MTSINVKLALVGTVFQFSEKSYSFYKVGFTSAIIACAFITLHMIYVIYVTDAQLSNSAIVGIVMIINLTGAMPVYLAMNRDSKAEPSVEYMSYLPAVHLGLLLVICLLMFYNGYLRYGNA
jgi:drug/metabolite transporter (DMT)-like permease